MKTAYLMLLAILIATPVFAQGMFTDVPYDHWAYDAVDKLQQDGIVIGYPDGTYGGKRSMTRYEFAVAIARLMDAMPTAAGGEGVSRDEVNKMLEGYVKGPLPAGQDWSNKADKSDVDAVKKLVDEFRDEIAALGVDVDAMKRDLAALGARVDALEKEVNRVRISGNATVFARASETSDGNPTDLDGRPLNSDDDEWLGGIDIVRDMDLKVTGRVAENVTANALINYGNYLNWLGQVDDFTGDYYYPDAYGGSSDDTFFPYYLYIDAGIGSNAALTVGRFPLQFTPYTLKMIDVDSYTDILKTSDGNYPVDGVKLAINLLGIDWTWFAVKNDGNEYLANGLTGQPNSGAYLDDVFHQVATGNAVGGLDAVTQTAGVRFSVGIPWDGVLGGTFYQAWNKEEYSDFDQARVYGLDLSMPMPFWKALSLDASWTTSDTLDDVGDNDVDYENQALDGKLSFALGNLDIGAGYKDIGRNFAAAGAWDKIGPWQNPTNIKGPYASFAIPLGESVKLCLNGEYLKVKDYYDGDYWAVDDKIIKAEGMLKWALSEKCSFDASYEWVKFEPDEGDEDLDFKYLTLGFGHQFSPNAKLSVGYQLIDTEEWGEGIMKDKGGLGVVQFGVSF